MDEFTNHILATHCHMIIEREPRLWSEACWLDIVRGARKRAKVLRRVGRGVRAFVAKYDPANTDERAKEAAQVFEAFMQMNASERV